MFKNNILTIAVGRLRRMRDPLLIVLDLVLSPIQVGPRGPIQSEPFASDWHGESHITWWYFRVQ